MVLSKLNRLNRAICRGGEANPYGDQASGVIDHIHSCLIEIEVKQTALGTEQTHTVADTAAQIIDNRLRRATRR